MRREWNPPVNVGDETWVILEEASRPAVTSAAVRAVKWDSYMGRWRITTNMGTNHLWGLSCFSNYFTAEGVFKGLTKPVKPESGLKQGQTVYFTGKHGVFECVVESYSYEEAWTYALRGPKSLRYCEVKRDKLFLDPADAFAALREGE